jgi:sterol desaturase/sphingolipid hydroxylase (fatty acid hydroxylase superfamily)
MLNFLSITGIITGIFTTATLTSYTICKIYDYPFYNPKMNEHQFLKKINVIANLSFFILLESILLSKYIFYNFIEDMPHSYLRNIINISFYSMCIELLYYSYHRIIHHKYFYKYIHSKHHENIEVYPLDTFYFGYFDSNFLILSFGIPIMFMRLNFFEHIFTLYIYIVFAYLSHSKLFYNHHYVHHKLFFCNYSLLIPITDILFNTYNNSTIEDT